MRRVRLSAHAPRVAMYARDVSVSFVTIIRRRTKAVNSVVGRAYMGNENGSKTSAIYPVAYAPLRALRVTVRLVSVVRRGRARGVHS